MYLQGKYFYDIIPEDIENLFTYQVKESKTLDYKRELDIFGDKKDKNRTEFFCDITALYNTAGGIIICGIEEKKNGKDNSGYPDKYFNQQVPSEDKAILQIQAMVRSNTDPQITNIAVRFIEVQAQKLLLIGVPKGIGLPAMVTAEKIHKFFRRNNSEKFAVMTSELNQMFLLNQTTRERADSFRKNRVADVRSGIYPNVNLEGAVYLHTIPYAFLEEVTYPINKLLSKFPNNNLQPLNRTNHTTNEIQYNADGLFIYNKVYQEPLIRAYNQFFRNGIIEIFSSDCFERENNNTYFYGHKVVSTVYNSILSIMEVYKFFQIEPPILLYLTITDINGAKFLKPSNSPGSNIQGYKFSRPFITVPPVLLTTYDNTIEELFNLLKPSFDIIWQSANEPECDPIESFLKIRSIPETK